MKIAIIHQYFLGKNDAGGSRWNQFGRYWAQAGHEITVLAGTVHYATGRKHRRYKGRFVVREREHPRVTVYRCHVSESYNKSFLGRFWAYLSFALSSTWAAIQHAPRPDIIVATSPPLTVALTMWAVSLWYRVPAVFEVRDLWPESAVDTGVLRSRLLIWLSYRLEEFAYRRASWINVLTPAFEEALTKKKHVSPRRLGMIPNGADLDIMTAGPKNNQVRKRLGLEDKFVVSYFGAHGRANRVGQLLDVAEQIKDSHPDIRIMLVGDGMEKPMLVKQARQRMLDNVIFVDSVPKTQVNQYINASDVCTAVLMRNDTFKTVYPNKVFDYMACRRPTIVAIDGAVRRLISKADAGLYAEPENPSAMVDAILRLKNDPKRAEQMAINALQFTRNHYNRKRLADSYVKQLQRLVPRS